MDLNQLFFRHQLSLIRAEEASSGSERERHRAEADDFAARIELIQTRGGASAAPLPAAAGQ